MMAACFRIRWTGFTWVWGLIGAAWIAAAQPARADEALFGFIYTTDSLPQGHWEYEQWNTLRWGKARGSYTAFDLRNEIEYGILDNFSGSLYINSSFLHTVDAYDPENVMMNLPDQNNFNVNGTSIELKYRLLSPYVDPIGLSLYLEPEISVRDEMTGQDDIERALEFRIILQKNFLDDLLVTAMNLMAEPEWEVMDGMPQHELWVEFTLGGAYRIAPNWFLGLEFRNHREYPDFSFQEHSAFFLGPTVHYGAQKWWATFTVLPQIAGSPQLLGYDMMGNAIEDPYRHLGQHEKMTMRLKFGINL